MEHSATTPWRLATSELETCYGTNINDGLTTARVQSISKINNASFNSDLRAKVIRNGQLQKIWATEIVRGDIIELGPGSICPAECIVVSVSAVEPVKVDQSSLTGESLPITKFASPDTEATNSYQASNVILAESSIISGSCRVMAFEVGNGTFMGNCGVHVHGEKHHKGYRDRKMLNKLAQVNIMVTRYLEYSTFKNVSKLVILRPIESLLNTNLSEFVVGVTELKIQVLIVTNVPKDHPSIKSFQSAFNQSDSVFTTESNDNALQAIKCNLNPEDMRNYVKELSAHDVVCTVGADQNDAPAMRTSNMAACLGVAGVDVAKRAADLELMSDNLCDLLKGMFIARSETSCCIA